MLLGLTGVFGCGKSTLIDFFVAAGWRVFDADACCHSFYKQRDYRLMSQITERWGMTVFDDFGIVDRKKIACLVFDDDEELAFLEGAILPLLHENLEREIEFCRNNNVSGVFEIPKLFEGGYEVYFDAVLGIWAPHNLRIERLKNRGYSPEEIAKRDAKQLAADCKLERADYALINSGTIDELRQQFNELIDNIS